MRRGWVVLSVIFAASSAHAQDCATAGKLVTKAQAVGALPTSEDETPYKKIRFDLTGVDPLLAGSVFTIEAQVADTGEYKFRRPKLGLVKDAVRIRGVTVMINGKCDPAKSVFAGVDGRVNAQPLPTDANQPLPHPILSAANVMVAKDKGAADEIALVIDQVEATKAVECAELEIFKTKVKPVVEARDCYSCHSGGPKKEAGKVLAKQNFTMSAEDAALCSSFLQRTDARGTADSPLVSNPSKGTNNHAKKMTAAADIAAVVAWIEAEKKKGN